MTYIAITADFQKIRKVRRALRLKGVDAYLPALVARRPHLKGRKVKYRRHVTPVMRYILAKAPDHPAALNLWLHDIKETKHVRGYVTVQGQPAFMTDNDVFGVWCQVDDMNREIALSKKKDKRRFRAGQKARFSDGTLIGRIGSIQWIKGKRAGLETRLFGSVRVVEVEIAKLEAA